MRRILLILVVCALLAPPGEASTPVARSLGCGTSVGAPTILMPGTMTLAGSEAATLPTTMTTAASETTTMMGSATLSVTFQPESVSPILRTGWMLVNWQHEEKIIPYLDLPGWRLDYDLPAPVGGMFRMTVLVIACPDEGQARSAWRDLTELSSLPRRTVEFTYPGVMMSDFQQGRRGSPSASARAEPLMEYQSTVWLPPYLVQVLSQVRDHGADEIREILDSVSR